MKHHSLTALKAKALPAGRHGDGNCVWLVKRDRDSGFWIVRVLVHGKRREMGLGRWPDVSIAEARAKAEEARKVLRDGRDPVHERKRVKRAGKPFTVKEAIEGCFEARKGELKGEGVAGRWMSPMSVHVIPKIGSYPVTDVDQHVLKELFSSIWNTIPGASEKALQRMTLTLKYAAANGLNVHLQATMKAQELLGAQRRTRTHIPSLAYEEVPKFYKWLRQQSGAAALGLRFLILTLARTTEIRMMTFDEIKEDVWTLPGERTKTDTLRRIPLVTDAVRPFDAGAVWRGAIVGL